MAVTTSDEHVIPIGVEDRAEQALKRLEKRGKSLVQGFSKVQATVVTLNQTWELAGRVINKFNQGIDATVGSAIRLQKEVAEVTTLVSDAAGAQEQFTEQVLDLQAQFGGDQADKAKAFYQALSSGAVDSSNAMTLLQSAQKLAIGGVTNLTTAIGGLTKLMQVYSMSADDSARISDILFIGMKRGQTTIGELSAQIGQAAGTAAVLGVDLEELVATVSNVATVSRNTQVATTAVRAAMVALTQPTEALKDVYNRLGFESAEAAVQQLGFVGTLKAITREGGSSATAIKELFGSVEALPAITAFTSESINKTFIATMDDMAAAADKAGSVTDEAFQKIAQTADFQLSKAAGQAQAALTRIGQQILVVLLPAIQGLNVALEKAGRLVKALGDAFDAVDWDQIAISVGIISTALTIMVAPMIVTNLGIIVGGFQALATWLGAAVVPAAILAAKVVAIGVSVVAVAAAIDILIRNFDRLDELGDMVGDALVAWAKRVERTIRGVILAIGVGVEGIIEGLNSMGLASDEALDRQRKKNLENLKAFEQVESEIAVIDKQLEKSAEGIDFGFAGQIGKFVAGLTDGMKKAEAQAKKTGKVAGQAAAQAAGGAPIKTDKEALQLLEQMRAQTAQMQLEADKFGKSQIQQIQLQLDHDRTRLRLMADKLKAEKKLTKEVAEQLRQQDILLQKQAEQQIGAIRRPALVDPDEIQKIGDTLGSGVAQHIQAASAGMAEAVAPLAGAASLAGAMASVALAPVTAANAVLDAAQALVDAIPNLIQKAADLISSVTDLPKRLTEVMRNLVKELIRFVAEFIPNIIDGIGDKLNDIIVGLLIKLPQAFSNLLTEGIPKAMSALIARIPELATALVRGLVSRQSKIAIAFMRWAIIEAPKLAFELMKVMWTELPPAILEGVKQGAMEIANSIANALGMADIFDLPELDFSDAEKALQNLGDRVSRSASQMFEVLDAEAAARGMDIADRIRNAIASSTNRIPDLFAKAWAKLREVWLHIWNTIIQPFLDMLTAAWTWIKDNILNPFLDAATALFQVAEQILMGVVDALGATWEVLKGIFQWFMDSVEGVWNTLKSTWQWIDDNILSPIKDIGKKIWQGFSDAIDFSQFTKMGDMIWNPIKKGFEGVGRIVTRAFKDLNIDTLFNKIFKVPDSAWGKGTIEKTLNVDVPFLKFAEGGVIPGRPAVKGDSEVNDRIIAMVSPGEAFIPRSVTMHPVLGKIVQWLIDSRNKLPKFGLGGTLGKVVSGDVGGAIADVQNISVEQIGEEAQKAIDTVKGLDIVAAMKKIRKFVMNELMMRIFEANRFHDGGLIPAYAGGGVVPIGAEAGEFVVQRSRVQPNLPALQAVNDGADVRMGGGDTYNLTINMTTSMDEAGVRTRLIPMIDKHLKRRSLEGRSVISTRGLRTPV